MKKILLMAAAVLAMTACGNGKAAKTDACCDAVQADTVVVVDEAVEAADSTAVETVEEVVE